MRFEWRGRLKRRRKLLLGIEVSLSDMKIVNPYVQTIIQVIYENEEESFYAFF